jgi:PEP-CTERM motif
MKHAMNLKSTLLLVIGLLGTAVSSRASTSFFIFSPDPLFLTVLQGATFDLHAAIVPSDPVSAFSFDISFPTFLQVLSNPTEEGFFADPANGCCFSWNSIDNVNGVISGLSDFSFNPDTIVDMLVDIQFTAVAAGTGQVTPLNVSLSDSNGNLIAVDPPGGVDVMVTATPEPATWLLGGAGVAMIAAWSLRRRRRSWRVRGLANQT